MDTSCPHFSRHQLLSFCTGLQHWHLRNLAAGVGRFSGKAQIPVAHRCCAADTAADAAVDLILQVVNLILYNNSLSGPAFPPAWLGEGSLPYLTLLVLRGNAAISGTIPSSALAWTALRTLDLTGTGLRGSVPQQWCSNDKLLL